MEIIFEILKVVLPATITSLFTFFITKYTYKNVNDNINKVVDKCKIYFVKYDKYIDISTKRLFDTLCNCNKDEKKKSIYKNFKGNIYDRNSYLRRRLGYLEPNFVQLYKYTTSEAKSLFRITVSLCVSYITLILCTITMNISNIIFNISATVFVLSLLYIICELIWCFLRFLYYKIRK